VAAIILLYSIVQLTDHPRLASCPLVCSWLGIKPTTSASGPVSFVMPAFAHVRHRPPEGVDTLRALHPSDLAHFFDRGCRFWRACLPVSSLAGGKPRKQSYSCFLTPIRCFLRTKRPCMSRAPSKAAFKVCTYTDEKTSFNQRADAIGSHRYPVQKMIILR